MGQFQTSWPVSPYGQGISSLQQPYLQTLAGPGGGINVGAFGPLQQQVLQLLQTVPQYLHQLQQLQYQQLAQLQQLIHIIPAQLQQIQQLVQTVPQHTHQWAQPWQPFGASLPNPLTFGVGSPAIGMQSPSHLM